MRRLVGYAAAICAGLVIWRVLFFILLPAAPVLAMKMRGTPVHCPWRKLLTIGSDCTRFEHLKSEVRATLSIKQKDAALGAYLISAPQRSFWTTHADQRGREAQRGGRSCMLLKGRQIYFADRHDRTSGVRLGRSSTCSTGGERRLLYADSPALRERAPEVSRLDIEVFNRRSSQNEQLVARSLFSAGITWPGVPRAAGHQRLAGSALSSGWRKRRVRENRSLL